MDSHLKQSADHLRDALDSGRDVTQPMARLLLAIADHLDQHRAHDPVPTDADTQRPEGDPEAGGV
jgi:hypothetical protein